MILSKPGLALSTGLFIERCQIFQKSCQRFCFLYFFIIFAIEIILTYKHMFKEKIVEGLRAKSEIKRFGLSNEAIDRIAEARQKTVTEESQVETVLTDAETMRLIAEELMKHRDQEITKRTETQNAFEGYKAKHPEKDPDPDPDPDPQKPDIAKIVADAVAAAVQPVKEAFETFKSQTTAKEAKSLAKAKFYENKWTTKFKEEADDAWERADELNAAMGGSMTQEDLTARATEYFNKLVQRKGADATKPFEDDGGKTGEFDFSAQAKYLEGAGLIPKE